VGIDDAYMRINPGTETDWGAEIRRFRRLRAVKQTSLAEMLGVDQATVSRWEANRQEPDLGMQRRLRALIQGTGARDEALLRHWVESAVGETALLDASRTLVAASATFLARHGLAVPPPAGLSTIAMFSEELDRAWWYAVERGFFEGEVASVGVVGRVHLLSGSGTLMSRSAWVPVVLNDGGVLCRIDTVFIDDADLVRSMANTVELVALQDLGG
jgi:transcriptional regulator with XRE-family HTH domain